MNKDKQTDFVATFCVACGIVLGNKFKLGIINVAMLCAMAGILAFLAVSFFRYVFVEKKGGLLSYCRFLKKNINTEIDDDTRNYYSKKWYQSPRYWVLILFVFAFLDSIFRTIGADYRACYMLMLAGASFALWYSIKRGLIWPLLFLAAFKAFDFILTSTSFGSGEYSMPFIIVYYGWTIVWVILLYLSIKVEFERRKAREYKKHKIGVVRPFLISIGGFILGMFIALLFYPYSLEQKAEFKNNIYTECYRGFVEDMSPEIEADVVVRTEIIKTAEEFCGCYAEEMYNVIDFENDRIKGYPDANLDDEDEMSRIREEIGTKATLTCAEKLVNKTDNK